MQKVGYVRNIVLSFNPNSPPNQRNLKGRNAKKYRAIQSRGEITFNRGYQ